MTNSDMQRTAALEEAVVLLAKVLAMTIAAVAPSKAFRDDNIRIRLLEAMTQLNGATLFADPDIDATADLMRAVDAMAKINDATATIAD